MEKEESIPAASGALADQAGWLAFFFSICLLNLKSLASSCCTSFDRYTTHIASDGWWFWFGSVVATVYATCSCTSMCVGTNWMLCAHDAAPNTSRLLWMWWMWMLVKSMNELLWYAIHYCSNACFLFFFLSFKAILSSWFLTTMYIQIAIQSETCTTFNVSPMISSRKLWSMQQIVDIYGNEVTK